MDGISSWLICGMAFIASACTCGLYTSFGTFFVAIIDEHHVSETEAAFVGSLSYSLCLLFGCIASPLCNRFGCRQVAIVGSVLYTLGLVLSSFVKSIAMLYLTFGIVFAIGSSAVYFASLLILAQTFHYNYALAVGIAGSGVGAGGFAFSSLTELSVQKFGLNQTFRFLAGGGLLLLIGAITYGKSPPRPPVCTETKKRRKPLVGFSIWKNKAFVIWTSAVCIVFFVYYIPYVHLVNLAADLNMPMSKASSLLGYFSIASCIGKIVFGKLADHRKINRLYLIQTSLFVVSICHTLCPLSKNYATLTIYSSVCGVFDGGFNALLVVVVGDIVGRDHLHETIGSMYLLCSAFLMLGPPAAGLLYSASGSYDSSFFIVGGVYTLANCLLFVVPWFLPSDPIDTKVVLLDNENLLSEVDTEGKLNKKASWITYDSGIDLTLQNSSASYVDSADDSSDSIKSSKSSKSSQSQVTEKKKNLRNLFHRNTHLSKKAFLSGSMSNTFALSTRDLNSEALIVVDRVTIV